VGAIRYLDLGGCGGGGSNRTFAMVVFCAVALIHNPILRFHFERNTWLVIDGISSAWMLFKALAIKFNKK
jgi:hypothetical protein